MRKRIVTLLRPWRCPAIVLAILAFTGCGTIMQKTSEGFGRRLTQGVLNQEDPQIAAMGLPAYLLLIDGLLSDQPKAPNLWFAGAQLYGAYAGGFIAEPERRKAAALKAERYARTGVCLHSKPLCAAMDQPFAQFEQAVRRARAQDITALYALAASWAGSLQADPSDWNRIADLPKVEALLLRVRELDVRHEQGAASMYLGVLNCIRPESLGGKPEQGMRYFAEAWALSRHRNQMARVLDAQYCARLLFDQERHDQLLKDVLAADAESPGLTLMNALARQKARELLDTGKDYF